MKNALRLKIFKFKINHHKIKQLKNGSTGIFSITVYAEKPLVENACKPGSGCC